MLFFTDEEWARVKDVFTFQSVRPTWKDRLFAIPFYTAYYVSYPFLWLAREIWDGIKQAKDKTWDE